MAEADVKEESLLTLDTEALDIADMKLESQDVEVHAQKHLHTMEDASMTAEERRVISMCSKCKLFKDLVEFQQFTRVSRRARLLERGYSVNMIINSTRTLLLDFKVMSENEKSLFCSRIHLPPFMVKCNVCGMNFIGIGTRLLNLLNHIESHHQKKAEELTLELIERYSRTLEHMREYLYKDQMRVAHHE